MAKSLKIPQGVIRIRKSKNRPHKGQKKKHKQRYTKHIHKTKDRVTRTPLKTGGELRCSGRVSSSCSTSDTRRVILVTNPMISHEWGRTGKCLQQVENIHGHLWHRYSITVNQGMVSTRKFQGDDFNLTKRNPWFSIFLASSNPLLRNSR